MISRRMMLLLAIVACASGASAAQTNISELQFKEIYDLLRVHLKGVSAAELNRAAVDGLISQLQPKATLTPEGVTTPREAQVTRSALFDGPIAYLRVNEVADGLADKLQEAYRKTSATNPIIGVVLDLRYAEGEDYSAAVHTAELFVKRGRPLLDFGSGVVSSAARNVIEAPIAVLVNRKTAGAAEALAAVLRDATRGLIIGTNTAGRAAVTRSFPLSNGQSLQIATAPLKLGSGEAIPMNGLKPDIQVAVAEEQERAFWEDPFLVLNGNSAETNSLQGATNHVRRRINEADLVRERREGIRLDGEMDRGEEAAKPVVRDPALARGLDLLKAIAIVRQSSLNN